MRDTITNLTVSCVSVNEWEPTDLRQDPLDLSFGHF